MTRSELIETLASLFPNLVQKDADLSATLILGAIAESLGRGDRVEIRGFGSFSTIHRKQRNARNPKTGNKVQVPAKAIPYFKAGKELRDRVDRKKSVR